MKVFLQSYMLKISVITPSFNRADMIEACIQSVLKQNYPNFEHIIADGGSTDGTLDLLKKYEHIHLLHGPDRGLYDAMNKGIAISTGEIVTFLNTDDLYGTDVFDAVSQLFDDRGIMAVAGNSMLVSQSGDGEKIIDRYSPANIDLLKCSILGSTYLNAWFFRRSVFDQIGAFDANYKIAGDREFIFRFALSRMKYRTIDRVTYRYFQHQGSITFSGNVDIRERIVNEHFKMVDDYLGDPRTTVDVQRLLKQRHSHDTLGLSIRYLKARNLGKTLLYALRGMQRDIFWLPVFVREIFRRNK